MIDHTGTGVIDVARSAIFYDAALGALGMRRAVQMRENTGTYFVAKAMLRPYPALNADAPSAWLLSVRGCQRRRSVSRRAGAPVALSR
jgi:catechol 2,3-dioxygenase-like lactoylglutathione lyase family enzyme